MLHSLVSKHPLCGLHHVAPLNQNSMHPKLRSCVKITWQLLTTDKHWKALTSSDKQVLYGTVSCGRCRADKDWSSEEVALWNWTKQVVWAALSEAWRMSYAKTHLRHPATSCDPEIMDSQAETKRRVTPCHVPTQRDIRAMSQGSIYHSSAMIFACQGSSPGEGCRRLMFHRLELPQRTCLKDIERLLALCFLLSIYSNRCQPLLTIIKHHGSSSAIICCYSPSTK